MKRFNRFRQGIVHAYRVAKRFTRRAVRRINQLRKKYESELKAINRVVVILSFAVQVFLFGKSLGLWQKGVILWNLALVLGWGYGFIRKRWKELSARK